MFKKNDPLVKSVQKVMEENERRRQIETKLCEELGIYSRKELPHEHQKNYDALLEQRINEGKKKFKNGQKVSIHMPGYAAHGHDGIIVSPEDGDRYKVHIHPGEGATGTNTKMKLGGGIFGPEGGEISGLNVDSGGTHTVVPASALRRTNKSNEITHGDVLKDRGVMEEEEGEETREGGAVVDTKTNKPVVSATASRAEGPSPAERAALTNKIKQMKEAMLAGPETGARKTPGSNQVCEENIQELTGKDKGLNAVKAYHDKKSKQLSDRATNKLKRDPENIKDGKVKSPSKWKHPLRRDNDARRTYHSDQSHRADQLQRKRDGEPNLIDMDNINLGKSTRPVTKNSSAFDNSMDDFAANFKAATGPRKTPGSKMKESHTLDSVMEEIKKKLGNKKMEEIDEQEDGRSPTNPLRGSRHDTGSEGETPGSSSSGTQTPAAIPQANSNAQQDRENQALASQGKADAQQDRENQALASTAKRDRENAAAFPASELAKVRNQEKSPAPVPAATPATPAAATPATPAAATPAAAAKPAPKPTPAAAKPAPTPVAKAENPYEKYGANEPDAPPAAFFRADMAARSQAPAKPAARPMPRPAARPARAGLRESLETTIRNVLKD